MATTGIDDTTSCDAQNTETWVSDPDGAPWEWYVKTGDAEQMGSTLRAEGDAGTCCSPSATIAPVALSGAAAAVDGCC